MGIVIAVIKIVLAFVKLPLNIMVMFYRWVIRIDHNANMYFKEIIRDLRNG